MRRPVRWDSVDPDLELELVLLEERPRATAALIIRSMLAVNDSLSGIGGAEGVAAS